MKFDRAQLAKAVDAALAAHRAREEKWVAERKDEEEQRLTQWLTDHRDEWAAAAKKIAAACRKNLPVTRELLPPVGGESWKECNYYRPTRQSTSMEFYEPPMPLLALAAILQVVTDDTVTTSGLTALGVDSKTLHSCVRYLGVGAISQ